MKKKRYGSFLYWKKSYFCGNVKLSIMKEVINKLSEINCVQGLGISHFTSSGMIRISVFISNVNATEEELNKIYVILREQDLFEYTTNLIP